MIRKASFLLAATALCCAVGSAAAQTSTSWLDGQFAHVDLGISGSGSLTPQVSGPVLPPNSPNYPSILNLKPSNTVGVLGTIRYTARPYVGFEFNYDQARYTENFSYPPPNFGVQTQAAEFSLGYVVTPPHLLFGLQPVASVGLGTIRFRPTPGGGQSLPEQARASYYYSLGLQKDVSPHFGVRVSFRQVLYLDPDFGQNYFTIKQRTITSEPTIGFYLRF